MENVKWRISFKSQNALFWYAVIAGMFAASLIAFVVFFIEAQERAYINRTTQNMADKLKVLLEEDFRARITSLAELSKITSNMPRSDWNAISQSLYDTQKGYKAIAWVDKAFYVRSGIPIEDNETTVDLDFALTPSTLSAAIAATDNQGAAVTPPIDYLNGRFGIAIYVPVFKPSNAGKELDSFIIGVLLFDEYIGAIMPSYLITEHQFTLFINEQKVYSFKTNDALSKSNWDRQAYFDAQGQRWRITLAPSNEFLFLTHYRMIILLILLGILLSIFITLAFYTAMSAHNKTKLIKDERRKIQTLLKNLPGMAYQAFDTSNRPMIFVSDGCEVLTGYTKLQLQQHSILWGNIIHPDDYKKVLQTVGQAVKLKRNFEIEYRIVTKNNDVRHVWDRGEPVSSIYHNDVILEGSITDITSVKQAEIALFDSNAFSEAIVNSVVEAVITIDNKGMIKSFNDAAQTMFGYGYHEVKDKNVKILMPEPYRDHHDQYLEQYLKTKETHIIGLGRELEGKRKCGIIFPIHLSVSEVHNRESQIFVGLIRDITQQRASEDQARLHIEQLAHAHRLNAIGEIAAGIAHEINQPLTAISLFSQSAKNFCKIGKFEMLPAIFEKLSQQSFRAGAVLERVQIMTRQGDRPKEVIDCMVFIHEVTNLVESEARLHDINVKVISCYEKMNVFVDRVQIQQVIFNLLRNGMEAMQSIACKNGATIELIIKPNIDNQVEISVTDTGCGVPKNMVDKLFTPFSSSKRSGTGIGLSISKSIVEEHGGQIHFFENKPLGATFYFTLPIHKEGYFNDQ